MITTKQYCKYYPILGTRYGCEVYGTSAQSELAETLLILAICYIFRHLWFITGFTVLVSRVASFIFSFNVLCFIVSYVIHYSISIIDNLSSHLDISNSTVSIFENMADADVADMLYAWQLGHYVEVFSGMYYLLLLISNYLL